MIRGLLATPQLPQHLTDAIARAHARATPPANRRDWYRIENLYGADSAVIHLYDDIGMWGTTAQMFVDELKDITAGAIDLHINSYGGEVFDGIAIYNCLKAHNARVTVYVDGIAASAASFIAQAGDKVIMARNAQMMIHDAAGGCLGNANDMLEMAALLDKLSDNIADIYAQRAGGTVEEWREKMRATTWYTGAEAVAAGLADEMTDPDPEPSDEDGEDGETDPGHLNPDDAEAETEWKPGGGRRVPKTNPDAQAATVVDAGRGGVDPKPDEVRGQAPAGPVVPAVEPPPAPAASDHPEPATDADNTEPASEPPAQTTTDEATEWARLVANLTTGSESTVDSLLSHYLEAL